MIRREKITDCTVQRMDWREARVDRVKSFGGISRWSR